MYLRFVSRIFLRRYYSSFNCETIRNVHFYSQNYGKIYSKFKWCKSKIAVWLPEQSIQLKKAGRRQFEFIDVEKVRKSKQIFYLYKKIWSEIALKEFLRFCRCRFSKNTKNFLMGSVGVTMYNWEQERITDTEMCSYINEIEEIHRLQALTLICPECHLRLVIDSNQPEVKYCQCYKVKHTSNLAQQEGIEWEPFTECKDMLVWRKEEKNSRGLYSYKVYGSFDDVTAEDFVQVQIDIDYRTKWDATVKELKLIDTNPLSKESKENFNDIIYWETIWPRMFANRDYVYQRKCLYNKETGIIIIVNKGTNHPNAPEKSDTYRVRTYWSYMVIKPFTNVREPGLEFGLTYFDDPGINVLGVTTWVIMSGLTNYLCQLREAVKNYKTYKVQQASENIIFKSNTSDSHDNKIDILNMKDEQESIETHKEIVFDNNDNTEILNNLKDNHLEDELVMDKLHENENKNEIENAEETNELDLIEDEERGLLDYFLLAKLFI